MEIEKVEVLDMTMNFFEFLVKVTLKDKRIIYFLNNTALDHWLDTKIPWNYKISKFTEEETLSLKYNLKPVLDKKCKEFFKKRKEENDKKIKKVTIEKIDVSNL